MDKNAGNYSSLSNQQGANLKKAYAQNTSGGRAPPRTAGREAYALPRPLAAMGLLLRGTEREGKGIPT